MTGAGFTRAFVPAAPLLVDDFDNVGLVDAVHGLPIASRMLEAERNRHRDGLIDVERLMTRLHELMPYDYGDSSTDEFAFLLSELKRAFLRRIQDALDGVEVAGDVVAFAQHCADIRATCVTFNHDDFLDAALSTTGRWNPYWGYGFFCQPSANTVSNFSQAPHASDLLLLKLHGSVNWWPRLGYAKPFALDAIVHHHGWEGISQRLYRRDVVARHLGTEPVIVPPVLSKSDLVAQPVLRLVWSLAFERLSIADSVTFIGYSFSPDRHRSPRPLRRGPRRPPANRCHRRQPGDRRGPDSGAEDEVPRRARPDSQRQLLPRRRGPLASTAPNTGLRALSLFPHPCERPRTTVPRHLCETLGASRETSIAKTKIEEAVMWAVKHITQTA